MAAYRDLAGSAAGLRIEVEEVGGGGADPSLASLGEALAAVAGALAAGVRAIPEDGRPDAVDVAFGLRALSSGRIALVPAEAATIRVTVTLGGAGDALATAPDPASFA